MRKAEVYFDNILCGLLIENEGTYIFEYVDGYEGQPISLLMPINEKNFESNVLFPFFDGLIPEGALLQIALNKWKIDLNDRMGVLLKTASDPIGAVSIKEAE